MRCFTCALAPALALALLACGGSDEFVPPGDDDPTIDAGDTDGDTGPAPSRVAAVSGDFVATGILSTVDAPSLAVDSGAVAGVAGADPAIRRLGDELFVINRFGGDNVTIVDAGTLALVDQLATGSGSNPQDVAVVGDKLYVAALGADSVLVIDRTDPDPIVEIDLSTLDDDGFPDCVSAAAVGTRVYVVCGLLDNFAADVAAKLVVIDTTDDSVETSIDLPSRNPLGWLEAVGSDLYMVTVPDFQDYSEGCLVRITTGATPTATCAISNDAIDGYLTEISPAGDQVWGVRYAYDASFNGSGDVVPVDLDADTIGTVVDAAGVQATDLTSCGDHVFIADKAAGAEGLRVYQVEGTSLVELSTAPLDIGLPPAFGNGIACMDI